MKTRPVGIFYEHSIWSKPLFEELERRRIPFIRIYAASHQYNPAEREAPFSILVNRVSADPSKYLAHVERLGVKVINGTLANEIENSKARQIELLAELGLPFPKTKIINHIDQLVPAAMSMRFPIVVKVRHPRHAIGVQRFASVHALRRSIGRLQIDLGIDHTAVIQEFIPARNGEVIRVETLNGKFLYAVKVPDGRYSVSDRHLAVEPYSPPSKIVADVERIVKSAKIDVGAVEYVVSATNEHPYYCNIIALSNFVNDAVQTIGFDPYSALVDYIEDRLSPAYEFDLAPGTLE